MTLDFPPKCAHWCSTYRHLKRLYFSPVEIVRVCHKCITWNEQQLKITRKPKDQLSLKLKT